MNETKSSSFDRNDGRLVIAHVLFAFAALLLGGIAGMLQGMVKGGTITLPANIGYYELLTAHGVLMALIFTTYFIVGFLYSGVSQTLGGRLLPLTKKFGWIGYWLMSIGTLIGVVVILLGKASVLYTFYAPMKASPFFYIALALVVIGSWLSGFGIFYQYVQWKKTNKGKLSPLFAYMSVITMLLWQIATIGVAAEVVLQLIPWSFGWVETVNVVLSRTLFWFFGHPLVYFWLLPAYICWYVIIPKIIGGKIFSDALARMSFVLFLLFSIPVGFHHQLMEPGISHFWKYLQVVLTFMVVIPSLMTAFSLFATFELNGRSKGTKGLFGWVKVLPWSDVRFFAPFVGMLVFIPAGAGGLINASNQMNAVVHNTLWVTGHFHLTVATSVALTFFGIVYWLIPVVTGRVERGVVKVGEEVEIVGIKPTTKTTVTGVEMFRKLLDQGQAGDNIGALIRGVAREDVERGQVLCKPGSVKPHTKFKAEAYILTKDEGGRHTPFFTNYRPQFYFRTTDVTGVVTLPAGVEMVMPGDNVAMDVTLIVPIAMEEKLRFAIREGGRTVGAGIVSSIIE